MVRKVAYIDGAFCLEFAQELPNCSGRVTGWDQLRIQVNLALQPNLWTQLTSETEQIIWEKRPDLRLELFTLPY